MQMRNKVLVGLARVGWFGGAKRLAALAILWYIVVEDEACGIGI